MESLNLTKVIITQDESSHWYVIPSEMIEEYRKMMNQLYISDFADYKGIQKFEDKFGKYRTGGDINNIQLYAEVN